MPDEATLSLFLGVDGGQTRSIAILTDAAGQVLGVGHGASCNHFDEPGGEERFRSVLTQIIVGAFAATGRPLTGLAAACFGFTGAWEHAPAVVHALLPVERLIAVEDTVTAHAGAFAGGPGIVVISGTGSVAYGQDETGEIARVGGWGYLMGDEGSGYDIGQQALRAAAQSYDGRGLASLLVEQIPAHFKLASLEAVQEAIYAGRLSRADIASLAALTAKAAADPPGDAVAGAIFEAAGAALACSAIAVAQRLAWSMPVVSLVGGVVQAGALILEPFTRYLTQALPEATVKPPRYPPVLGAILLALQTGGHPPDQAALQRLDQAAAHLKLAE